MPRTKDPSIHGVISYKVFFEKPAPDNHIDILSKYPTDVLIILLSKVNAILFQSSGSPQITDNEVFRIVFNKMNPIIYRHVDKLRSAKRTEGAIFTQPSIVKLMGKLISRYRPLTDKDEINDAGVEVMMMELFESILAINGEYFEGRNEKNLNTLDHIWRLEMLQQEYVRKFDDMFGVIPLKVFLFIRFINERFGENVLKEFADAFGVPSPYNFYFAFLETVSTSYSQYDQDRQPRYTIADKVLERVVAPFIFDPSQSQKTPFNGETYVLINQPFYRFSEGIAVLDFSFFHT